LARADHPDRAAVGPREMFGAKRGSGAHAHVLQRSIVDEGQRLTRLGRDEQDQAAIGPGLDAVLFLCPPARRIPRPLDDVGLHADCKEAVVRPFHGAPAKIAVVPLAGDIHVDPRAVDRPARRELREGRFHRGDALRHRQRSRYCFVVDDQHHRRPPENPIANGIHPLVADVPSTPAGSETTTGVSIA